MKKLIALILFLSSGSAYSAVPVDVTPPTVSWTQPQKPRNQSFVSRNITLSVDAIDNVAIKQVRMKNPVGDGPDIILTPSGNGVAYYTVFDTRSIPNGAQLFTIYAIDTAGLLSVTQATVTVKIDNLAPSILFDVSDGAVLTQKKSIVVTSADNYSLLEDSLLSYPDTYNSNFVVRDTENNGFIHFQVAPESLPRGDYKVTAWAKDLAGNENTKILTLKAALNSPPFSHDMALTVNKNSSIEFEPSIEDPDSADLPDDTITNGPFHGKIIQHDPYTFTYRPDVNYIGADSFQYFAKDKILNLSLPATAYVYVRSPGDSKEAQIPGFVSPEILSVVISSPATNTVGDFMVMGASVVATTGRKIKMVAFYFDNTIISTRKELPFVTSLKLKPTQAGVHKIRVEAIDSEGNRQSSSRTITVVLPDPTYLVDFVAPQSGAYVRGVPEVRVFVSSITTLISLSTVKMSVGNVTLPVTPTDSGYRANWDTRAIPFQSNVKVSLEIDDSNKGHVSRSAVFTVDNTPPVVDFTTESKTLAKRPITQNSIISATAFDTGAVDRVEFRVNGALVATMVAGSDFSFVLQPSKFANGPLQVSAQAFDAAGNSSDPVNLSVTVLNTTDVIVTEHPLHGSFAQSESEAQIYVSFSGDVVPVTGEFKDAITVHSTKDGQTLAVSGSSDYRNRVLTFTPDVPIPVNTQVTWRLPDLKDSRGNIIGSSEFRFTRPFLKNQGGTLSYDFTAQGNVTLIIPPNALPENIWVDMQLQGVTAAITPVTATGEVKQLIPPFSIFGRDETGNLVPAFLVPARLTYTDLTPPAEADEQSRVVQFENLDGNAWHPVAKVAAALHSTENTGIRTVTVPISRFATYRVASVTVTGNGLTDLFNYPNPFAAGSEETILHYVLDRDCDVTIVIYDLFGNLVKKVSLHAGEQFAQAGQNPFPWDGRNGEGTVVANGGYLVQITAEDASGNKTVSIHKIGVVK